MSKESDNAIPTSVTQLILMLEDFDRESFEEHINRLRRQLKEIPELKDATLKTNSRSTALLSVNARNRRQQEKIKRLIDDKINGWTTIERSNYGLPETF